MISRFSTLPRQTLLIVGSLLLALLFITYILFQARYLLLGPLVTIETPNNHAELSGALVTIKGTTFNTSKLLLNDRQIFVDQTGHFQEELLLPMGYTVMNLTALDRFGREREQQLGLIRIN